MSAPIELEIRSLLLEHGHPDIAADRLVRRYEKRELLREDVEAIAGFLLQAGFIPSLIRFVGRLLEEEYEAIPWAHYAEALAKSSVDSSLAAVEALEEGAKERDELFMLLRSRAFDHQQPRFTQLRQDIRSARINSQLGRKREMIDQLSILATQQLFDREKQVLGQLERLFPGDPEVQSLKAAIQERVALDLLSRRSGAPQRRKIEIQRQQVNKDLIPYLNSLTELSLEKITADPWYGTDIAMVLFMFEAYEHCRLVLLQCPVTPSSDWLMAETLLQAGRYLDLLEHMGQLELRYIEDPETPFACNYYRAQGLWGLGQWDAALSMMHKLVESRPSYRSASTLLGIWQDKRG